MARIFVTGGAGYIGSHACKALAAAGHEPITYDTLEHGFRQAVQWGPLEVGDVRDRATLETALRKYEPEAVFHMAGYVAVSESAADPAKYYSNNIVGSLTLLEAMRDVGIEKIVFSSTAAVYGNKSSAPVREFDTIAPSSPYGRSKLWFERILADFGTAHGMKWVALRYFNAAGADPDGETGACHDPMTHLIPNVVRAGLGERGPLTIFGTDFETPDGTAIRDYIHVSDLANAHVAVLEYLSNGGDSSVFNVGIGCGYSVRDVIETTARLLGRPVPHSAGPRRTGDAAVVVANAERARQFLRWKPRHSELEKIVESVIRWERSGVRDFWKADIANDRAHAGSGTIRRTTIPATSAAGWRSAKGRR